MSTMGGGGEGGTVGGTDVQYRGGYHGKCVGISLVPWGCSQP